MSGFQKKRPTLQFPRTSSNKPSEPATPREFKSRNSLTNQGFWHFLVETKLLPNLEEQPHKEMANELEEMLPLPGTGMKRKIYLAPRYSYKSALVKAFMIYAYLLEPNVRIVYGRASEADAEDVLLSTKLMLVDN